MTGTLCATMANPTCPRTPDEPRQPTPAPLPSSAFHYFSAGHAPEGFLIFGPEPPVPKRTHEANAVTIHEQPSGRAYWGVATSSGSPRSHLASSPFQPQPAPVIETYVVDDRVSHDTYGLGRVVGLDAGGATVDFMGEKIWITTPFRKMTKL